MNRDLYKVLELTRQASREDVRRAFRRLARRYHPDANPEDAGVEDRFKEIQHAHEVLSDPERRREYDESLFVTNGSRGTTSGGFGDIFSGRGRTSESSWGPSRGRAQPVRGEDVTVTVELRFKEGFEGVTTRVTAPVEEACGSCAGEGTAPGMASPCGTCRGRGRMSVRHRVAVRIPSGARSGTRVRLAGRGNAGRMGGEAGDLYVLTEVEDHPVFERRGDDFVVEAPVGIVEAALGTQIEVPLPDGGTLRLRVPPGMQDGKRFRVRGAGAPKARSPRDDPVRGDLVVRTRIVVPEGLTRKARGLLEALADELDEDVRGELLRRAREAESS